MTKKPKKFSLLSFPESSFETSSEWKNTWKKIAADNKKTMDQYMKESSVSPYPWLDKALFNPHDVIAIFTQTMEKMSQQGQKTQALPNNNIVDVPVFLNATMNRLQKETRAMHQTSSSLKKKQDAIESEENPFFFLLQQSYLLNVRFFKEAARRVHKIDPLMGQKLTSYTRRLVDILSLNPEKSQKHSAPSRIMKDIQVALERDRPKNEIRTFKLGKNLGVTPGKVVFQNDLFQLIQYDALTPKVAKRPLLIVPPWTNKYYIFDLGPKNSFIEWALESGLTVFVMSWINPTHRHFNKTMADYVLNGLKVALGQVCEITGEANVNTAGYCTGGTLLGCLMAYLKAKNDSRISSATLIGAPFDFRKIDTLGIYLPGYHYHKEGILEKKRRLEEPYEYMVQSFNLLRANDLIWSSDVNHYILGQIPFPFDMLHWAYDALRIPPEMHSFYLRKIFIENGLMEGTLFIEDIPINLKNISTPLFVMASHEDHVVPWQSTYAVTQMGNTSSQQFILSDSGHIAGIFTHPHSQKQHYWTAERLPKKSDDWFEGAKKQEGCWWDEWRQWLGAFEGGKVPARSIPKNRILEEAPGSYAKSKKR
jgi:polyhydroxyalkanoate synthase